MTASLTFVAGDLDSVDVLALLHRHRAQAFANSPADAVHALDLSGLRDTAVTFWSVRSENGDLVGMGALKSLEPGHAEIKSMRVTEAYLGKGVGRLILNHLLTEARTRGLSRVSLETGGNDRYAPARAMYESAGFRPCGAFGGYVPGDFTKCYSLAL